MSIVIVDNEYQFDSSTCRLWLWTTNINLTVRVDCDCGQQISIWQYVSIVIMDNYQIWQ